MSHPREVLPGSTYMVTRRCTQRQFLMRPDADTTNAFIYCLAVAAARAGVQVIFTLAHSNHHHTGIHDPLGTYPIFLEHFHKLFAKSQNALRGRWENFWASEQTSVVRLVEPTDVLVKMVYALTNPVKDHIVERAHHWPGASSLRAFRTHTPLVARRPAHFFRETGGMPETVTLHLAPPPGLEHVAHDELVRSVDEQILAVELAAIAERRATGRLLLGRAEAKRQRWWARPKSVKPHGGMKPRVASRSRWARVEALLRARAFVDAYRAARAALTSGRTSFVFPPGTYWLRRFRLVPCADEPPA